MTYLEKSIEFIKFLESHRYISNLHVYSSCDTGIWEVYFSLTGYVYGKYFAIDFQKITNADPYTKIVDTTECNLYMKDVLIKFKLS